ncbi:phosphate ABC transporter substrate-binding protein [Tissierella praeacuta]|uniref:Phosphate ABC transporter substrate-binding protein, PhoT family n=1 Tax=Tissierella praeacuta DSM 18095 TaxID=1123404 RepID=A0A1M4S6A7_9FIRM|nr:phosphate ABC transporter substrate-binding protein [Tissierella praeacuta]SHE27537.1 phosphate ABC transporter substrate-binding protein, PhoT family [Tissierella praeacuta DSM 18095]SUP00918.1 Phosphate-binding protein pstS precursor [Tissierella praeacuta]
MKKRISLLLIALVLVTSLFGCRNNEDTSTTVENEFKAQMTFNGSSTLAPVISAIATDFIEANTTWDKVDASFPDKNISIYVSAGGSGAGVKSVIEGTSDFGMLARGVKDEEKEKIGDMKEFVLGIDALTISINPENPLVKLKDSLSTEEIMKIFSGEYKYWDDLDDSLEHKEIVVVIRDLGGGAHEVFQKSIMGDVQVREDAIQSPSMGALVTKIIENKDAIGYASFGMVNQNVGKLIPLKVDGIEPTEENIVNGSYKVSRPLIVVKRGELTSEQKAFMDFVLSDKGSEIIAKMGFVPTN